MAIGKILRAAALFTLVLAANNDNKGQNNNNKGQDNNNKGQDNQNGQQNNNANNASNNNAANNNANNGGDNGLALDSSLVQKGSTLDGQQGLGAEAGQAASATSNNNFINFCQGQTLTNGLQITAGSCNGIVMGKIPAKSQMISSVLLNPKFNDNIPANQDFNITVQVQNLVAGSFTNADATYYAAPQDLQGGLVVGHTHVTVQDLGNSLNPQTPPDPTQFAFFKGINDAGNGKGLLSATVAGGLPAGNYRVCTLTSASNHQPVIMPVAQRGSQDDCQKFTVSGAGGKANEGGSSGSKGQAAQQQAQQAANLGAGAGAGANNASDSANNNANNGNDNNGKDNSNNGSKAKAQGQQKGQQQGQDAQQQGQQKGQQQGQNAQQQGQQKGQQQAQGASKQGQQGQDKNARSAGLRRRVFIS